MHPTFPIGTFGVVLLAGASAAFGPSCLRAAEPSPTAPSEQGEPKRMVEVIQDNSFFVEEAYNQEEGVVQHIFNAVGTVNRLHGPDDRALQLSYTDEWPLWSETHQFSYTIPYLFTDPPEGRKQNGIGDILLNYRLQLTTETPNRPATAWGVSVILPSGSEERGLGSGHLGFETSGAISKVVTDRLAFHANIGTELVPHSHGHDLWSYELAASAVYAITPQLNVQIEAVAAWEEEIEEASVSRGTSIFISPGIRYGFLLKDDAHLVFGVGAPIGLTRDAPDYGIFVYASYEHAFSHPERELTPASRSK